ncbi:MAG: aldehyde dehydrogenase family protein, partial [Betaproteobacteria bacterium]
DIAERVLQMLEGAMHELRIGDPRDLATDVGPVIDAEARDQLLEHIERMRAAGLRVIQTTLPAACANGTFVPPTLVELDHLDRLQHEVFGPVLHVLRFDRDELPALIDAINATGYGLTHGIQSRIDETVDAIVARVRAGNIYVNRNIIGAVVGVQPFGGTGLSGTGPKAGGPLYLRRLVRRSAVDSTESSVAAMEPLLRAALATMIAATVSVPAAERARLAAGFNAELPHVAPVHATALGVKLPGPTGESNSWSVRPRGEIACVADSDLALLEQIVLVVGSGNRVLLQTSALASFAAAALGPRHCRVVDDLLAPAPGALLVAGPPAMVRNWRERAAAGEGAILPVIARRSEGGYDRDRLVAERVVTVNTTASGGNTELLAVSG